MANPVRQVIDFHVHPFVEDKERFIRYCSFPGDPDEFMSDIVGAGITRFCGSVIDCSADASDFAPYRQMNRHALALRERYKGAYIPGIHIHPAFPRESCEELEEMHRQGVRLIGELVPYIHGWDGTRLAAPGTMEIFDLAQQLGMVVSFHPTNDEDMERVVSAFPHLTFVAAHPGEKEAADAHIGRMKKYPNLHLDLSGTGLFRYTLVRYLIDQVGADRILFATDYPICNPAMYLHAVLYEKLTGEELDKVLYRNAERLLGL